LPEIVQEIGAAAGLAAVAGLAVLSVLYFSQARDVKRLREWAGRAPERAAEPSAPQVVPGRVQAQPQPKPAQPAAQTQPAQAAPVAAAAAAKTAPGESKDADGQPPPAKDTTKAGKPEADKPEAGKPEADKPEADTAEPDTSEEEAEDAPRPAAPVLPATAGARAAAATQAKPAQAQPVQAGNASPAAPSGPGGPATPAGGRPPGAPPVPPAQPGPRMPVRPMLPPRPMPQQTAIIPPPRQPWYRRLLASPRYLVLAVAGILILGGAGAFGIDQLSKGDDGGGTPAREGAAVPSGEDTDEGGQGKKRRAVVPANVTVAVLNGTTVAGLAKQVADEVESQGFNVDTVANTSDQDQQRADSVVLFSPGHAREAVAVSRRLKINQRQPIDPGSQQLAGDATVVVITGGDLAQ